METNDNYFSRLLGKYRNNTCTRQELEELLEWAKDHPEELRENLETYWNSIDSVKSPTPELFDRILQEARLVEDNSDRVTDTIEIIKNRKNKFFNLWPRVAAAMVLVLAGALMWYMIRPKESFTGEELVQKTEEKNDALPGGNKATLTLADGSTIVLDDTEDGMVTQQGEVSVLKVDGKKLAYDQGVAASELVYNTITTPRGGQYQLELSDGSKVWLNAESSLKFPVSFVGNVRDVELTGEGYFEVAKDAGKPFYVTTNDMKVQVLGTQFNVNAYVDEGQTKTTLIEGSVELNMSEEKVRLTPGQQGVANNGSFQVSDKINVESVVAWKNGVFYFDKNNIREVMRQLARWYDVSITYEGTFSGRTFSGQMKRDLKLSQVMKILEYNNIKYQIIGKQMIISP